MPFAKVILQPGLDSQKSPTLNSASWSFSQLMRFQNGLPQKLGGWAKICATAITGIATGMHSWADLLGIPYLAVGTDQRLQVMTGGALYDITPVRSTTNPAVDFSTTATSTEITVVDPTNLSAEGDWLILLTQVAVGGIVLFGYYQITSEIDANTYTFDAADAALSTISNSGLVPQFTTTIGQATVTVTLINHGLSANDNFPIEVSTAVGGLTLFGNYTVASVTDANNFVITAGSVASSSTSGFENGGDARIEYLLSTAQPSAVALFGYGLGYYGAGYYGISSGGGGSLVTALRQWSMDNWGQDLNATYTYGQIYTWTPPPNGTSNPATVLANAPEQNLTIFVMMPAQILVAAGTETGLTFDPNLVRWSDSSDNTTWIASALNQAGSYRIPTGSKIVGSMLAVGQGLIWTDIDLWSMTYIGQPFIFSFNKVGSNCGLASARAKAILNSTVVWMGVDNFFAYTQGGIRVLPCPVWDKIFRDLDTTQIDKVTAGVDSLFNEIFFFYPSLSGGTGDVDKYVKLNVSEGLWDFGDLDRTAWDEGGVFGAPIGADLAGFLQQHEVSANADGSPLAWAYESGDFDVAEGEEFVFIDRVIPDFVADPASSQIKITITARDYPDSTPHVFGPYLYTIDMPYLSVRIRGRQACIRFEGNDLGSFVRLGAVRYRAAIDGRR